AESLEKGLSIQSGLVRQNNYLTIEFIEYINQIHILLVLKDYIEKFGKMLSEQFRKIATFIIETKLILIVNYIIWNVFRVENICIIPQCVNGKIEDLLGYQTMRENLHQNGINQKLV